MGPTDAYNSTVPFASPLPPTGELPQLEPNGKPPYTHSPYFGTEMDNTSWPMYGTFIFGLCQLLLLRKE